MWGLFVLDWGAYCGAYGVHIDYIKELTVTHQTPKAAFDIDQECLTYSVPRAGKLLGISRNAAYEAARRNQLPTIRIGRKIRVPKVALQKLLSQHG